MEFFLGLVYVVIEFCDGDIVIMLNNHRPQGQLAKRSLSQSTLGKQWWSRMNKRGWTKMRAGNIFILESSEKAWKSLLV